MAWFNNKGILIYRNDMFLKFTADNGLSDNNITRIAIYGNDIWVGTLKEGINLIKKSANIFNWKKDGLKDNYVSSVYEDEGKGGSIIIGTSNGLYKITEPISQQSPKKLSILPNDHIYAIKRNINNDLIIGTHYNGLYIFNKNKIINYNSSNGLKKNFVRCIYIDKDSSIWLGTNGVGIMILKSGKFRQISKKGRT